MALEGGKGVRLDKAKYLPKKYEPFTFAHMRSKGEEHLVFISRVDGPDVYYRHVRDNAIIGREYVVHSKTDALRPALKNEFRLVVERDTVRKEDVKSSFEISLPISNGMFIPVVQNISSRQEALKQAKEKWGADSRGRVTIVNEVKR